MGRRSWIAVLACVTGCWRGSGTVAPRPATAADANDAGKRFVAAIERRDVGAVRGMLGASVAIDDVQFEQPRCRDLRGSQRVEGTHLDVLSSCLVELERLHERTQITVEQLGDSWRLALTQECGTLTVVFHPGARGDLTVSSIADVASCGVLEGVAGGVLGDSADMGPPPPPPPPPPAPPTNVPPTLLEGNRIAGSKLIVPDDMTKVNIERSGVGKVIGSFKLCLDTSGNVARVTKLKSTGFGDYDLKIESRMQTWRYRPYEIDGKAVPVCTAITFIYTQTAPPPPQP